MQSTAATNSEVRMSLLDDLVPDAGEQTDRADTFPVTIEALWPWMVQLGKDRAGWYLPRVVERLAPTSRRAISWTLALRNVDGSARLHHRLRIRAKHANLVNVDGVFDPLTTVGMFAGPRERIAA